MSAINQFNIYSEGILILLYLLQQFQKASKDLLIILIVNIILHYKYK